MKQIHSSELRCSSRVLHWALCRKFNLDLLQSSRKRHSTVPWYWRQPRIKCASKYTRASACFCNDQQHISSQRNRRVRPGNIHAVLDPTLAIQAPQRAAPESRLLPDYSSSRAARSWSPHATRTRRLLTHWMRRVAEARTLSQKAVVRRRQLVATLSQQLEAT